MGGIKDALEIEDKIKTNKNRNLWQLFNVVNGKQLRWVVTVDN